MLSVQASCLKKAFFFGLMSPPSFFSRRERERGEQEQRQEKEKVGEGRRSETNASNRQNLKKLLEKR